MIAILISVPLHAQRAEENAVLQAEDAFGISIGNEDVGIYSSNDVRGFSPTTAGNIRIDGLYYDQVWEPNSLLRSSTTIRVGISALGFPFPAPTGVVDYALRKPGADPSLSFVGSVGSYGDGSAEFDMVVPILNDKLSLGGGVAFFKDEYANGTSSLSHIEGFSLRWSPSPDVEIMPFWSRSDSYDDEVGPVYVPAGAYLPPRIKRQQYLGPQWVEYEGSASTYGTISRFDLSPSWQLRGGIFRSFFANKIDHFAFITDLTLDGRGNYLVFADPPSKLSSTSGEFRLTRKISDGIRLHQLHLSLRARDRQNNYDGGNAIDLGTARIGERVYASEPSRIFGVQTRDRVTQQTLGLGYEGRWKDVGELNVSIQKTRYSKQTDQPTLPIVRAKSEPWLFSFAASTSITNRISIYGGYTKGLEESGTAPQNATNRNEGLPAIITVQRDFGIRWNLSSKIKLIAGLFDVRKPYFNLDAVNRFALMGDTKNQGLEMSLSGAITDRVDIVAGGVLSRPRVTGEGVSLGRLAKLPVGQTARKADLNFNWRPAFLEGLSFDLTVAHSGRIPATRDNSVFVPARTLVDLGGRFGFKINNYDASIRVSASNVFNTYGYDLQSAGAYELIDGRRVNARLAIDF
jgi:iron complex outermembrane recepter protein